MSADSHESLRMAGRSEVWIDVAPDIAYGAVADLTRMGEWSTENRGGEWISGSAGAVGATFLGRNEGAPGQWETVATVTEAEPPRRFAFVVAPPGEVGTAWCYTFRPSGTGTNVTETFEWYWTPTPKDGFRGRVGRLPLDEARAQVAEREAHLRDLVDGTLARLKRVLEAPASRPR